MEAKGMSKASLGRATGIPYHRLNPWFIRDNAKPNAVDIEAVAGALNVHSSFLITGRADEPHDEKSWILAVYESLPSDKQSQLEGFARYLAEEAKGNRGTGQKGKVSPEKADPDT